MRLFIELLAFLLLFVFRISLTL